QSAKPRKKPNAKTRKKPNTKPRQNPSAKPRKRPNAKPRKKPSAKPRKKPSAKPKKRLSAKPRKKLQKNVKPSSVPCVAMHRGLPVSRVRRTAATRRAGAAWTAVTEPRLETASTHGLSITFPPDKEMRIRPYNIGYT